MKKNKITISNKLIEDLKTYTTQVCVGMASFIRDEMNECAQQAIEYFYDGYRPKNGEPLYYHRHYDNFRKRSFKKYYNNPHNSIIRGGVELTPNELEDVYRADTDYVFNLVYAGYHGSVWTFPHEIKNVPPVTNPSPLDILLDRRLELVNNIDKYSKYGINRARKQSYSTIKV